MKLAVSREIWFHTARSGGKGGQNVNKVETMVEGNFWIEGSLLLTREQKEALLKKLSHKLNANGILQVRSRKHRTQLENKDEVVRKIHELLEEALKPRKKRIKTVISKAAKQKRLENKKKRSERKEMRRKTF